MGPLALLTVFTFRVQEVTDAEQKYAAMSAGASATSEGGSTKSLAEELADCKGAETEAVTMTKQAEWAQQMPPQAPVNKVMYETTAMASSMAYKG